VSDRIFVSSEHGLLRKPAKILANDNLLLQKSYRAASLMLEGSGSAHMRRLFSIVNTASTGTSLVWRIIQGGTMLFGSVALMSARCCLGGHKIVHGFLS
jgi:hypothetical protein